MARRKSPPKQQKNIPDAIRECWCVRVTSTSLVTSGPLSFKVNARMTVSAFVTEFLKQHADSVRPNTLRGYHTVWNEHIEPRIGTKKRITVKTGDVDNLVRSIAQANSEMRHGTLARVKAFIHLVYEEAIRKEIVDGRNPAASAKVNAKNKTVKPTGCNTDAEAQAVIAAVPNRTQ
jgi:hypothetical protein